MIVSHKYKYIFIRPIKVAGTSVMVNLAKHVGREDIVTPISSMKEGGKYDSSVFSFKSQNYEGYTGHMLPMDIRKKIGDKIWDDYYKFTIVRNPWDLVCSRFYWEKVQDPLTVKQVVNPKAVIRDIFKAYPYQLIYRKVKELFLRKIGSIDNEFEFQLKLYIKMWMNTEYYFDKSGDPICDDYLHFEDLEGDYKKLCNRLGIPYSKLVKAKDKVRNNKKHYSEEHNDRTRKMVEKVFEKEIKYFNCRF